MQELSGKVGRYEICGHYATRSAGELYAARESARHPGPNNLFGLTLLPERDTTQRAASQLRPALRRFSTFVHPGFAHHHDVFAHQGRLVVAHDFVRGETLRKVLSMIDRAQAAVFGVSITLLLAKLLDAAHSYEDENVERGLLVHGDLSPSTVLVTHEGKLVLVDAGLALAQSILAPDRAGLRGHYGYMARERAGSHADIGTSADVYSLGLMFYEILAGAPAIEGKSDNETIALAVRGDVPLLASRVRVSDSLARVIDRMIAPDPTLRPSARDVVDELSSLRSSRLASWNVEAELGKLMQRHFAHRAQAMRTLEERWIKRSMAEARRPIIDGVRPLSSSGVLPRAPSGARAVPPPAAAEPVVLTPAGLVAPPVPPPERTEAAPLVLELSAILETPSEAELARTDDLPRHVSTGDLPRPRAHLSFVRGLLVCCLCTMLVLVSTAWWPAEWRQVAMAAGDAVVGALEQVLAALGRLG